MPAQERRLGAIACSSSPPESQDTTSLGDAEFVTVRLTLDRRSRMLVMMPVSEHSVPFCAFKEPNAPRGNVVMLEPGLTTISASALLPSSLFRPPH